MALELNIRNAEDSARCRGGTERASGSGHSIGKGPRATESRFYPLARREWTRGGLNRMLVSQLCRHSRNDLMQDASPLWGHFLHLRLEGSLPGGLLGRLHA